MQSHRTPTASAQPSSPEGFPTASELAALRAWYQGLETRDAVARYLENRVASGGSSRAIIRRIRDRLCQVAISRLRPDLAQLMRHKESERAKFARAVFQAVEALQSTPPAIPNIGDAIEHWLAPRSVQALHAYGIRTLADLTVRVARRKMWWVSIPGLGAIGARQIEAFFAQHPALTDRARELIVLSAPAEVVPWETFVPPQDVDGSQGTFRAPKKTCTLNADNDYQAVQAWLSLHESGATLRAYRKEAERLILWAILERGRALSSLTVEDAVAYRAFLRRPSPTHRWVGPPKPRTSPEWRPFGGPLSSRSVSYAVSVIGALYRWLMEQGYLLANPFSGIKVRGASKARVMDTSHVFTQGEWGIVRAIADGLEWSHGWTQPAAQRLRFILDFGYATGLRAAELVGVTLRSITTDSRDEHWLQFTGKGSKAGKVALPPLARSALDSYLVQRGLPTTRAQWDPKTPLIGSLGEPSGARITATRLLAILKRFFGTAAKLMETEHPALAEKLRQATTHWMRHTHATHALAMGAELVTVRDNLRHSSISTTSTYLHGDDAKRSKQIGDAFAMRS
ncbi:MAG TPA: site-specific integrase [Noviherbaspirillum sp.]